MLKGEKVRSKRRRRRWWRRNGRRKTMLVGQEKDGMVEAGTLEGTERQGNDTVWNRYKKIIIKPKNEKEKREKLKLKGTRYEKNITKTQGNETKQMTNERR